jgi:hypothetical protein
VYTTVPIAELLFSDSDAVSISTDESTVKSWDQARACIETAAKAWLSTVRPNGRPHNAPLMPVWVDDVPWFTARPTTVKARNIEENACCVLTASDPTLDLVIEGTAQRERDEVRIEDVAAAFQAKYGWKFTLRDGSAFEESLPGSPEYAFYRVIPRRAFGYGADGQTATRWRFE